MTVSPPSPELRRLVDRLMEGEPLARTEMARLEDLLESPEALAYYLSITSQEGLMPEAVAAAETATPGAKRRRILPFRQLIQAVAASVIFFIGWKIGTTGSSTRDQPAPVVESRPARITGLMGVEWNAGEEPDLLSRAATARRLSIRSGLVEVTYASGVRVTLEGPADFTVNDTTSGKLDAGKLVASVPKGAEGFRVDYAKGNVVDLGTEFAMDARNDGAMELGVLDGKVNLNLPGEAPRPLLVNQSIVHGGSGDEPVQAIPFDREKFVRRLPARDFRWDMTSFSPKTLEFDVSHLIWKGSRYRAIFKWIHGQDAIVVRDVALYCDDKLVVGDSHTGSTGILQHVHDNRYQLDLPPQEFRRGRWTIRATIEPMERLSPNITGPVLSQGILQLEEGLVTTANPADFIGKWSYYALGRRYVREFHADGTVSLSVEGQAIPEAFEGSRWTVENGVLRATVPDQAAVEEHVLRNPDTLIFTSRPYDNATRMR